MYFQVCLIYYKSIQVPNENCLVEIVKSLKIKLLLLRNINKCIDTIYGIVAVTEFFLILQLFQKLTKKVNHDVNSQNCKQKTCDSINAFILNFQVSKVKEELKINNNKF